MALGKLGKEMADAFGDYFLKSRKAVAESDTGRTQPKPAAKYIKEMQRQGVSDEEMKDLGLTEFDPKGPRAQEQFTKQEMLDLIDERRANVGQASTQMKDINSDIPKQYASDEVTKYGAFQVEIGNPDSYREVVYSSKPKGILGEKVSTMGTGMHFEEPDQLFHLRLNSGVTVEDEPVLNLLELQSDIQQRAQRGEPSPTDPNLPMKDNWEKLGVKEAIKLAVKENKRYLAIPPSDETASSVGARQKVSKGRYALDIDRAVEEGEFVFEPYGYQPSEAYERLRDIQGDEPSSALVQQEVLQDDDLLEELGFFEDTGDYVVNRVGTYADSYLTDRLVELGLDIDPEIAASSKLFNSEGRELFEKFYDGLDPEEQMQVGSYDEFMRDFILTSDAADVLADAEQRALDQGTTSAVFGTSPVSKDNALKLLGIDEREFAKRIEESNKEGLSFDLSDDTAVGGEGLMNFYDVTIQSEKRLKELGVPVVEITQLRPDGTQVKTKAFDLKSLQGKKPKDIPYSLYSLAAGIVTTSGALATMDSEEPKMYNQGGFVNEEDGQQQAPVGALNEEVADDIPARLSEGEFVLPADVVRYIGLDKLMKMRQQAKAGLERMADMGQLSNQEEATVPDDAPFKPEVPLALAQGGSVYDPRDFNKVQNKDNTFRVKRSTSPAPTPAGGYTMKKFVNEAGSIMYVPFMGGKPMVAIPDGYTEVDRATGKTPEAPTDTPSTPVVDPRTGSPVNTGAGGSGTDDGSGGSTGSDGDDDPFIGSDVTKDAFEKALEEFSSEDSDVKSINEEIANAKKKTGLAAFLSVLTGGGVVSAIAGGAKGLMGIKKLEEKRASVIANSDKFDKFLNDNYTGKELSDALAGRQNYLRDNLDDDAFQKYADDQYDGWMKIAEEQARARALEKKKRDEEQAAREEAARVEAYKEAQRKKEREKYQDLASKIDSGSSVDTSNPAYVPPSQRPTTSPGAGGGGFTPSSSGSDNSSSNTGSGTPLSEVQGTTDYVSSGGSTTVGTGGGNASSGYSYGGWKKGGLIKKRKRK